MSGVPAGSMQVSAGGRVVVVREGQGLLGIEVRPVPAVRPGCIRIRVEAAGVNRADLLQRRGVYPAPPGVPEDILGLELAGCVEATSEGSRWRVGDRVMGIVGGGAMAEFVVAPEAELVRVPEGCSSEHAAAIPEAFTTALDALDQAELATPSTVLVHAIGSSVGLATLRLAKHAGHRVVGTTRSATKLAQAADLGLLHGLRVGDPPSFAADPALAGGAHAIVDTVGAAYLEENLRALAPRGTLIALGLIGGAKGALPMGTLLAKRARIVGSVLRSRGASEREELARRLAGLVPLFESGTLRPDVDRVLPVQDVVEAHRLVEANANFGKVVLRLT